MCERETHQHALQISHVDAGGHRHHPQLRQCLTAAEDAKVESGIRGQDPQRGIGKGLDPSQLAQEGSDGHRAPARQGVEGRFELGRRPRPMIRGICPDRRVHREGHTAVRAASSSAGRFSHSPSTGAVARLPIQHPSPPGIGPKGQRQIPTWPMITRVPEARTSLLPVDGTAAVGPLRERLGASARTRY